MLDRRKAGEIPAPTPEAAREIFRRAQGAVPRAGISHGHRACRSRRPSWRSRTRSPTPTPKQLLRAQPRPLRHAGAAPGPADRVPDAEEAQAAADAARKVGTRVRRARQGARPEREGHRSRPRDQVRHHRPGGRRRGLRAEGRRGQRAGEGRVRHGAGARGQDRAGEHQAVRGGRSRDQADTRDRPRARASLPTRHDKIEDERAGGMRLAEVAQKLNLTARTIEAVDRQGRDPDGKPVTGLPTGMRLSRRAFRTDVGVENEPLQLRAAAMSGTRSPASRRRASARSTRSRTQVEERWRDDQVAERLQGQGRPRWSTSSRPARRSTMSRRPTGLTVADHVRPQARPAAPARCRRARSRRCSRPPKDAAGSADGKDAAERVVFRVTDITVPTFDAASTEGKRIEDTHAPRAHRRPAGAIRRAAADRSRRDHQPGCAAPGRRRAAARPELDADRAGRRRLRGALCARRAAGGVDHAGRRPRNAGLGVPEDRRRARQ